jgi:hypothetical protein
MELERPALFIQVFFSTSLSEASNEEISFSMIGIGNLFRPALRLAGANRYRLLCLGAA